MEIVDRAEEWRRLQASYSGMTDEELQALADDRYELTEVARQVLNSEATRRGLRFQLREAPGEPGLNPEPSEFDPSQLELVVVQRVWDLAEAQQVKSVLEDAGIPSFLGPHNVERVEAFSASFEGGVDLKVRYADNQRALSVLSRSLPAEPQAEKDYVAVCPKCHSPEIVLQRLDREPDSDSSFEARFNWSCDACGYHWQDDGIEKEAE